MGCRDFSILSGIPSETVKKILDFFMGNRNFIACLENFRVGDVSESSIQTTENATNVQSKAINAIYEFVKALFIAFVYDSSIFWAQ